MPIRDAKAADLRNLIQPCVPKAEIYEALCGLNAGIQRFLTALTVLDKSGLDLPFLNGYRILADEIRSALNFSTMDAMTVIELRDYKELENSRMKFGFPSIEHASLDANNHS